MENPIKDNRIVSDRTFARRLRTHLKSVTANCAMGDEEVDYLKRVADSLLEYQMETCPDDERRYHENCDGKIDWDAPREDQKLKSKSK